MKKSDEGKFREILRKWEIASFISVVGLGSLDHFVFSSTGFVPLGLFSPVNESVWEHLKLATYPLLAFASFEYFKLRRHPATRGKVGNFILAKAFSITIANLFIPLVFYSYTPFVGDSILAVDIGSFIVGTALGHLASFKLISSTQRGKLWRNLGIAAIGAWVIAFTVFTFWPPRLDIFMDGNDGSYGLR